ncbi:MAG TPA: hypothetical protein VF342_06120 [Alphaproteobacteria bacterium]
MPASLTWWAALLMIALGVLAAGAVVGIVLARFAQPTDRKSGCRWPLWPH